MNKLEEVKQILKKYNHEYLLEYYERLNNENKERFLDEILEVDFQKQEVLFNSTSNKNENITSDVETIGIINPSNMNDEELKMYDIIGTEQIKNGKLAIVTLAGGQGTRLGHPGPKGTYMLLHNKSLFEILCDTLKKANKKYDTVINWYIMTSRENIEETIKFFEDNNYFDYPKESIKFFKQNDLPMNKFDGELVVNEKGLLKLGADGHGGVFEAMLKNGVLEDIKQKGIEWIFVTPVDNPLIELVDSTFVGVAIKEKYNIMSKAVEKEDPNQKSGVFCLKENCVNVLEYTEISTELMNKTDENGNLFLRYAHINCNMFNIKIIDEILDINIPYHIAKKKAKYLNENGQIITPEEPNAYKYEKFIFDYFPYIQDIGIFKVDRKEEYEPIKSNAEKAKIAYMNKKGV